MNREHSDAVGAAEEIIKGFNVEDDKSFQVALPRQLVAGLNARFSFSGLIDDMVADDLPDVLSDPNISEKGKEKWLELTGKHHEGMRVILKQKFEEAIRSGEGVTRVGLSYREVDHLGRPWMGMVQYAFENPDQDLDSMPGLGRQMADDFLIVNGLFVAVGGKDNVELRNFYEGLLGRKK